MRYLILGPLDVRDGDRSIPLGSAQQRALLAALVLRANEPVTADELIEALWGENAPATAGKIVQNHVSSLRRLLSGDSHPPGEDVIVTRAGGYLLRADPDEIDAVVFERLVAEAGEALAAGDPKRAAALSRDALALWRGAPLADFQYESFAQTEIGRLQEQRLLAIEHRVEADLSLGKHQALLAELGRLAAENPLRERLWELQMLALYRAGRQADALAAYQRVRTTLTELGLEPGDSLQELQHAILVHDPELGGPSRRPVALARNRRGWALIAAGGAALLAAGVAAAIALLSGGDEGATSGELRPLPESFCSPVRYQAGTQPQLLIASDQALQGAEAALGNQVSAAIEFTLRRNHFMAGSYPIAYQACDDSTAAAAGTDPTRCSSNAEVYAGNPSVIGVIGPLLSECATVMIPVANQAGTEPLPMVSPTNTLVGLTRPGLGTDPGEPEVYYPTGVRNYVRLMPADDYQIAADAVLAHRLGLRRVFVLWSEGGTSYGSAVTPSFGAAAGKLGVEVAGSAEWSRYASEYERLVNRVRQSGADGVFLAGTVYDDGGPLIEALRSGLGQRFPIMASDGFAVPDLVDLTGLASEGMTVSNPGIPPDAVKGPGRRFVSRLTDALGDDPHQFAVYAAMATELLLDAIARSDGTRASVIEELFDSKIRHGLLGDFAVTKDGDTTANQVTIYRVRAGRLQVDQVIEPSSNLLVRG